MVRPLVRRTPIRMPIRWALLLALFLVGAAFVAAPSAATTPPGASGWYEVETQNFHFYGTDRDELIAIGRDLESLRALFVGIFPDAIHTSPPTSLFVFPDESSFAPYSLGRGGVGFFQPHDHAHYGGVLANSKSGRRAVRRQYLHELVHANSADLPLWLRHGTVEVYAHSDVHEGRARIGLPIETLQLGTEADLAWVLGLREFPDDPKKASLFLGESWLLAHYLLIEDAARRQSLSDFVGRQLEDPTITIDQHLGLTTEALDAVLEDYRASDRWPIWVAPPPSKALAAQVRSLSEARALAHLSDLLLHTGDERRPAALAHAARALELDPEDGLALGVLGRIRHLEGDPAGACESLRRARERLPERFALHFWHGLAELDAITTGDAAVKEARVAAATEALRRALALDDEHAEAWARLGYALTLGREISPEAVEALGRARERLPERTDIDLHLLLALARLGDGDAARELLADLETRGVPDSALFQAREILFQVDFKEAVALARSDEARGDELETAIEAFERIAAGTTQEALREQAETNATRVRLRLDYLREYPQR